MKLVPKVITRKVAQSVLSAKQNSPKLFFAAGIVGVGVGTVLACRATLKLEGELDEWKDNIDSVKDKSSKELKHYADDVEIVRDVETHYSDLIKVHIHGAYRVTRLYAPAIVVSGAGLAALVNSHVILSRRNATLTAAYATLAHQLEEYRQRIRDEVGEERERELYLGLEWQEVPGSEGKLLEPVIDPGRLPMHSRFWGEDNQNWKNNSEYNRLFINCQQQMANDLLQARGHVFLNDVYDMLGLDRSNVGQLVGWVLGGEGDDFIDFGEIEAFETLHSVEVGGPKPFFLEFNVDPGMVWDQIEGKRDKTKQKELKQ